MVSRGSEEVPTFDGRGASSLDYERQGHLWIRTTRTEASARASVLILHLQPALRQVCLADGSDVLGRSDGVAGIWVLLRNNFAPEAADEIRRQVLRFTRFRRTDQSIDESTAAYELLRRKAEPEMGTGARFPGQLVTLLRMDCAALSRHENRWSWRSVAKA